MPKKSRGMTAEEKAELLSIGSAAIDDSLLAGGIRTTATAGPGAGGSSFFIRSENRRVRLSINPDSPLKVIPEQDHVAVVRDGRVIARGRLERPLCHCPREAYITISERCVFNCKFCPVPLLAGAIKNTETIISMVEEAAVSGELEAISLTSGVADTPERELGRAVEAVRALRMRFDLPIGVSIYPTRTSSEELRKAGADEIKYNVETMDPDIFSRVCPGLSLPFILESLEGAVPIFGRNHVASNFIIGLGETDACVKDGVETLAGMGVIPVLRPISPHPLRKGEITIERPSAPRLLLLARLHRDALNRHGLDPGKARTMCLPCTGCDLTPCRDI
ncbi:MAG: radical SAM protein [Methanomicrobiales archaeon]|jgi:biotin synthase-related radical SAM superfamily protein